jgi:hypothetical protein
MKYIKFFEQQIEFKVGDIVKFSVDRLRIDNYLLTDLEKMSYYKIVEIHKNKETYYSLYSEQLYFDVIFANEIEKLSEYELDVINYNL